MVQLVMIGTQCPHLLQFQINSLLIEVLASLYHYPEPWCMVTSTDYVAIPIVVEQALLFILMS